MTVHVSELHTDVRANEPATRPGPAAPAPGTAGKVPDETWRESRGRIEWLQRRTAADGFDD